MIMILNQKKILILCGQETESESVSGNAMQIYDLVKNKVHSKKVSEKKSTILIGCKHESLTPSMFVQSIWLSSTLQSMPFLQRRPLPQTYDIYHSISTSSPQRPFYLNFLSDLASPSSHQEELDHFQQRTWNFRNYYCCSLPPGL